MRPNDLTLFYFHSSLAHFLCTNWWTSLRAAASSSN